MDDLSSFEFWLDSPSDNFADGMLKFFVSEAYSIINAPTVLLTGRTISGFHQTPTEKMENFIGVLTMMPMTKSLKLAHPGTNTDFYKKFGENYFTRKKYKKKMEQYKNLNKNKNSFDWIYNYFITPFNEAKEGEQ